MGKDAWRSRDERTALSAVNDIVDATHLKSIVLAPNGHWPKQSTALYYHVKALALSRITDTDALLELTTATDPTVRDLVASAIQSRVQTTTDQDFLLTMVFRSTDPTEQVGLITRITDENALISGVHRASRKNDDLAVAFVSHMPSDECLGRLLEGSGLPDKVLTACVSGFASEDALVAAAERSHDFRTCIYTYRVVSWYDPTFDDLIFRMIWPLSREHDWHVKPNRDPQLLNVRDLDERRALAQELADRMEQDERLARLFWRHIAEYVEPPVRSHYNPGVSDDYGSRGSGTTYGGGLAMEFPSSARWNQ
jgi:hypothetical protein